MTNSTKKPDNKMLRQFGLIFGLMLVLFLGLLIPWIWNKQWPLWPWYAGAAFWLAAIVFPIVLLPVYIIWIKIGDVLGWINTRIILFAVFYLVIFPSAIVMKLVGRDPMARKIDSQLTSYRIASKKSPIEKMERPF